MLDLILKLYNAVNKGLWPRRTPRDVHINRQKTVTPLNRTIGIKYATAAGTAPNRYHITRFGHLIIDAPYDFGHLFRNRTDSHKPPSFR
jgi:hypothetical protein